ncbi:unnamed protein product [Owenia fusiformis]|uniref:Mitochondrial import inner membrane translocase subunit TIM44 n=1 Tax=Owenia fusiformis TaxID=6347 RepID=A0A8J1TV40_OWEFU|nr:unnamed protein product [Owenia fusiformis]
MATFGHAISRSATILSHLNQYRSLSGVSRQILRCTCSINNQSNNIPDTAYRLQHGRYYSQGPNKGFISGLVDNIRQEWNKNKEMKDSLKKFKEEAEKLEKSDALKKVRERYENMESETAQGADALSRKLGAFKGKLKEGLDEVQKTDYAKKASQIAEEVGKTAGKATESLGKTSEQITQSDTFRSIKKGAKAVKKELDDSTIASRARPYKSPEKLLKREDLAIFTPKNEKPMEADEESTGMVMHKDSKFYQSWQNFKDNNQYVTKMFDLKSKYDESDHIAIRATRTFTDKMSELFGGMFQKTEMSEVLTEICKMDPTFDKELFIKTCQLEIIPNVLEALVRGDLDILKDWCHEAAFNVLSHPIKQAHTAGYRIQSKVLDVNNVDIVAGKMMEQGPVLIITFNAQQIQAVVNSQNAVVEGDSEKIMRILYVWALCRDQTILDPKAAWRLIDISASSSEQWL